MDLDDEPRESTDQAFDASQATDADPAPAAPDPEARAKPLRAKRLRRALLPLTAVGVVLALVAVAVPETTSVVRQRDDLRRQEASTSLAAQALAAASGDTQMAARLALAAYRVSPTPEAVAALAKVSQDNASVTRMLRADAHPITTATQDRSGTDLFAASDDGALRRWDMTSGRLLAQTKTDSPLAALAPDPSGARLLGVDDAQNVFMWNTGNRSDFGKPTKIGDRIGGVVTEAVVVGAGFYDGGARIFVFLGNGTFVTASVADPSDESSLNTDTVFKNAGLPAISTPSARKIVTLTAPYQPVGAKTESRILLATADRRVVWLDLDTGSAAEALSGADVSDDIDDIAVDPFSDGTQLAVVAGGVVNVFSLPSRKKTGSAQGVPQGPISVLFDATLRPGADRLVVGTRRGAVIVPVPPGTVATDPMNAGLSVPLGGSLSVMATPELAGPGSLVAIGSYTGTITIVDPGTGRRELPRTPPSTIMAFDGHGHLLLDGVNQDDRTQGLYSISPSAATAPPAGQDYANVQTYLPPTAWWPQGETFYANDAFLDDRFAAVAGQDPQRKGVVLVWDAKTGAPIKDLTIPGGAESTTAGIPDFAVAVQDDPALNLLVARDGDGRVIAWSTTTWQQTMLISTGATGGDLAVSPDGSTAAVGLEFGDPKASDAERKSALGLIDLRTRRLTQLPQQSFPYRIHYSPSGDRLAVLTSNGTLRILDASGTPKTADVQLPAYGTSLAYGPTGDRVAVALNDSETAVYDAATGSRISADLPGQYAALTEQAAWAPTGTVLAIGTGRRVPDYVQSTGVELWDMNPADWAAGMCTLAGVGLSPTEWKQYSGGGVPYVKLC